jgi:hypothetical protein
MEHLCLNTIAAMLVLSNVDGDHNMLAIEKQLESTYHLRDDAMANVTILSKIDCAYSMSAIEGQLESAKYLRKQRANVISLVRC